MSSSNSDLVSWKDSQNIPISYLRKSFKEKVKGISACYVKDVTKWENVLMKGGPTIFEVTLVVAREEFSADIASRSKEFWKDLDAYVEKVFHPWKSPFMKRRGGNTSHTCIVFQVDLYDIPIMEINLRESRELFNE